MYIVCSCKHCFLQAAVRAQVEEKERQKKLERERKFQEDLEEERKLQAERDMLQKQYEMEQQKIRQKEVRLKNFIFILKKVCLIAYSQSSDKHMILHSLIGAVAVCMRPVDCGDKEFQWFLLRLISELAD